MVVVADCTMNVKEIGWSFAFDDSRRWSWQSVWLALSLLRGTTGEVHPVHHCEALQEPPQLEADLNPPHPHPERVHLKP